MAFESGKRTTVAKPISPADTTIYLASVPTVTSGRLYLKNDAQEERISFSGVSWNTVTGCYRNLSKVNDPVTSWVWLTRVAWTVVKLVAMHDQIVDKASNNTRTWTQTFTNATTFSSTINTKGITFTGTDNAWLRLKSLTTAQRDALTPNTWDQIYNSTTGTVQTYYGWTWNDAWTSTTPNASTTVAGKVEKATSGEVTAWTSTGWTGAELFVWPAELKNVTDWFAATNSQAETWTATWVFINPVQLKTSFWWTPIAWTTITMCSSTTVTTTNSATYIKKYQATIQRSWTYTVTFWIKTWWSWLYYGRIYKNGVAFWTERTSNTTSYDTFNENLTFAAWDTVELWLKYASWIHTTDCNGISVTYSVWPATTVTTY